MPRKLSTPRLLAAIGGAVCALAAAPGAALAAECPIPPTKQAFAQFGDTNSYVLAPGGDFESGADSLYSRLTGGVEFASVNEPFQLAPGHNALELNKNGESLTSKTFCVDRTMPHMRFVAKGTGQQLDVTVEVRLPNGTTDTSNGNLNPNDHASWAPSRYVDLKTGAIPVGQSATAKVTFRTSGTWLIDSVFLDPYRR
jgi:hypothetical protein